MITLGQQLSSLLLISASFYGCSILSPKPNNLFLSLYRPSSPSWSENKSLSTHRSAHLGASWKQTKAVTFSVLGFSFQSYSALCSLQRENHDFLETRSYLGTPWHQDCYDVKTEKWAKAVSKEGTQAVDVIIAEMLDDYVKTKLFIFL